jgi:hypothetical protein
MFLLCLAGSASANGIVLYDSAPSTLPPNLPSLGYQATSTTEFGQAITLAMNGTFDITFDIYLSNWALESTYQTVGTSAGYYVPMTLSLYTDPLTGMAPTSTIATTTTNVFVPWRPEASTSCTGGAYMASDGNCYNGSLSSAQFQMNNLNISGPVIVGLMFNTQSYGPNPTGAAGPYNSLNFALNTNPPTVGSNTAPGSVYWNTSFGGFLANPANAGIFAQDPNWSPYTPAMTITGTPPVPEPASMVLTATGLLGVATFARRRRRQVA